MAAADPASPASAARSATTPPSVLPSTLCMKPSSAYLNSMLSNGYSSTSASRSMFVHHSSATSSICRTSLFVIHPSVTSGVSLMMSSRPVLRNCRKPSRLVCGAIWPGVSSSTYPARVIVSRVSCVRSCNSSCQAGVSSCGSGGASSACSGSRTVRGCVMMGIAAHRHCMSWPGCPIGCGGFAHSNILPSSAACDARTRLSLLVDQR